MEKNNNPEKESGQAANRSGPADPRESGGPAAGLPWWLHIMLAVGAYCALKYLVPSLHLEDPTLSKMAEAAPTFAPLAAIPFLLLAAKRLYDTAPGDQEVDGDTGHSRDEPED